MDDKKLAEGWMNAAYEEAEIARENGDVPVGAVIVYQGEIIARAHNMREETEDPTAHAEMLVMREAAAKLGTWNLSDCILVSTLEPCPMCTGTLMQAHIGELIYAAYDMRSGCCGSVMCLPDDPRLNAPPIKKISGGFMQERSRKMLFTFFDEQRRKNRA